MSYLEFESNGSYYSVYEDGHLIGEFYPGGGGGDFSFKDVMKILVPLSIEIIFAAMCIICPIIFFCSVLPGHGFVDALLEGAHLVALFITSVIVTVIMIKRRIFNHLVSTSDDPKYVRIRQLINDAKEGKDGDDAVDAEDKEQHNLYVEEISSPLERYLSIFRIILICLIAVIMLGKMIFPTASFSDATMMVIMPMFAYGYIISIISEYMSHKALANFLWLSFFIAVLIASFLMGFEPFEPVAEHLTLISILGCHEITSRILIAKRDS